MDHYILALNVANSHILRKNKLYIESKHFDASRSVNIGFIIASEPSELESNREVSRDFHPTLISINTMELLDFP